MRRFMSRGVPVILAVAGAAASAVASGPADVSGSETGVAKIEGYVYFNVRTGELVRTPTGAARRDGDYWRNSDIAGSCDFFMQQDLPSRDTAATGRVRFGSAVVDWGDIPAGASVNGFDVAYATNVGVDPGGAGVAGFDLTTVFLDAYDGSIDPGGTGASGIAGITLQDIPGGNGATGVQGWVYVVDLEGSGVEFNWSATDLDGDGLHDFGYGYSFDQNQAGAKGVAGPYLVRPLSLGGSGTATGVEDALDWFNGGDALTEYVGPIWFGGGDCPARPYASTYMTVYGQAGPEVVNAFGFDHTASGSATLEKITTPLGSMLLAEGLGGPGDRFSVNFGRAEQMGMDLRFPEGGEVGDRQVIEHHGSIGGVQQVVGELSAENTGEWTLFRPDFSALGASTFTMEVYEDGRLVERFPGITEFRVQQPRSPILIIFGVIILIAVIVVLLEGGKVVGAGMAGLAVAHGDEIRIYPDVPTAQVDYYTGLSTYSEGIPSVTIPAESIGLNGVRASALGEAHLMADLDRVKVSHVGTTGLDGLLLSPGGARTIDWAFDPPCFDCPICPDRRWIDILTRGRFGAAAAQSQGSFRFTANGADWEMTADYSAVGSDRKRLIVYRGGSVVQEVAGFTGSLVGVTQDPPSGCGKGPAVVDGQRTAGYFPRWSAAGTLLTIPGYPTVLCDAMAVLAEAPAAEIGEITEVSMLASDIPEMIIFDVEQTAFCPVDLNRDGLVDFSDYLDFLNRYEIADPAVDFNGDGLVDFSDYLEFLNLYDAGC